MSSKIGRFEILSEITHSDLSCVYKANDPETGQTVALKAIRLEPLGEQAAPLVQAILEEAEACKVLKSHNIAFLHGAGEMEGHLCASMEYVQGNSIATMLARKEGFSIWDLQDIARQACQGLDHAHAHKAFHWSLEPEKVMVQWDGIVKMLSFGVSAMGAHAAQASGKAPAILHYMSPEQLRGDPLDERSNLFSLGAILYEMVTERKAFAGEDADQVRQSILEMTPVAVDQINRKIHPALSAVIMKALSKAPEERYQSGQDLVTDLERCKENPAKVTVGANPAAGVSGIKPERRIAPKPAVSAPKYAAPAPAAALSKAAAASGGADGASSPVVTSHEKAVEESVSQWQADMSAATIEEPEVSPPRIAVDPMMDESRQPGAKGPSFSEVAELPPLKEVYVEPPPPPPPVVEEAPKPAAKKKVVFKKPGADKSRTAPREVARKAVAEIRQTPPQMFLYGIAGAVAVIVLIVGTIAYRIHSGESDDDSSPAPQATAANSAPAPSSPAPAIAQPVAAAPVPEPPAEPQPTVSVTPKYARKAKKAKTPPLAAPVIVPGQVTVESIPQGAQIAVDGTTAGSPTPFNVAGLAPGQHTIAISKPGYATETRSINVASGSNSVISVQLAQLTGTVSANSDPSGATVWVDGSNSGKVTPAQISIDKPGNHTFLFKKPGYLDETTTANVQIGQTLHLAPSLRVLGTTDEIKLGGRFKRFLVVPIPPAWVR